MARHAGRNFLAFHGEIRFRFNRAIVTGLVDAASAGEGFVESLDK